jgi:hypothetical protein
MENCKTKPVDTKLAGVPANNVPNVVGSWLKRKDAKRADAFEGSPVPLSERVDRRR